MERIAKTCFSLAAGLCVATAVAAAPVNDRFADRLPLRGLIVSTIGDNIGATQEVGEPDHWPGTGARSVWWSWTAPADGLTSLTTSNSSYDTLLAVYTGAAVSNLTLVANNDDGPGLGTRSRVQFTAAAGTVYQIAVDGFGRPNAATGAIQLNIAGTPPATPVLPPVITVTQPADQALLRIGNVALAAEAYDDDGAITKVEFYRDTTKVGEDVMHPYSLVMSNVTVGNYQITAVATDNSGMASTSAVVAISVVVNPPPLVSLTAPTNNQSFTVPLHLALAAAASDSDGLAMVEFFAGNNHLGQDTTSPYSLVWSNVLAGSYALRAVATDMLGVAATSAVVNITVTGNYPPSVRLTNPGPGAGYPSPTNILISADASDLDGTVASVAFYQGTSQLAELADPPYEYSWNNVSTGLYVLTAVATDDLGLSATSVPVSITVTQQVLTFTNTLIAGGSLWRYFDLGFEPDVLWTTPAFNDTAWASGPAELGYGDGDEATLVGYGPDPSDKYVTTYFRHTFTVSHADTYTNLSLQIIRDDGAVVYLNGEEVHRSLLPLGPISYGTYATTTAAEPVGLDGQQVNPALLVDGPNVLAVEVHQANADSSDLSFDLQLVGVSDMNFSNGPPAVALTSPADGASFAVPANLPLIAEATDDFGIAKIEFFHQAVKLGEATTAPYQWTVTNALAGTYVLHAVVTDVYGLMATSAVVTVSVTGNYPPTVALSSPPDGARFVVPANLVLEAAATDLDGTVVRVQFFEDDLWLGETNAAPFRLAWSNVGLGDYHLTAVATDNLGVSRTSAVVTVSVLLNVPPTVAIVQPPPNSAFINTELIALQATASDVDNGVTLVEFFQGGIKLGEDASSPYQFTWSGMATGTYHLQAVATDLAGLRGTSAPVRLTVVDTAHAIGGLGFDGVNDYVTFGAANALGLATFTLETWFKWTGGGAALNTGGGGVVAIPLLTKGRGEQDGNNLDMNYFLGIDSSTARLAVDFEGGAGAWAGQAHPAYGVTAITPNVWHHAAATYDGTSWRLYLDGVLETETAYGHEPRADSVQHAALGSALNSTGTPQGYFAGIMDEARVWNYARTPDQVASNRLVRVATAAGLVGRWSLDETNGTTAFDTSGSGVHGDLINGPFWTLGYPFESPPTVTLTNPAANDVFFTPATITLAATAGDEDGAITLVEFFANGVKLGDTATSPFQHVWTTAAPGYVTLTAAAIDNSGLATTSAPVQILIENSIVQLTSPTNTARFVFPDPVPLAANVSEAGGPIVRVEFFDGDTRLGDATGAPYTFLWTDANLGPHALAAVAINNGGLRNTSAVIQITVVSNVPPSVALSYPPHNTTFYFPTNLALTANASDSDGSVTNVVFFANNAPVAETNSRPYRVLWAVPDLGVYELFAVVVDDRGLATTSAVVSVTIQTNTPPQVVITEPPDGRGFIAPATVTIDATATDLDGVARVEFFAGTNKLGEATASPYRFTWSSVPIGAYQLRAVATDPFGLAGTSPVVNIVVTNNDPPLVALTTPTNGAIYTDLDTIGLAATASDSDGIERVEFFRGAIKLGEDSTSPYTLAWSQPNSGGHALTAVATDGVGLRSTSAPVNISVIGSVTTTNDLIALGADWSYLDNGTDQGSNWTATAFDDSAWASGPAELGYGDGDEATVVSYGTDAANKHITTYFRRAFVVTNAAQFNSLHLQLKYDDGGAVYLNGTEIFRVNLPSGGINYLTTTPSTAENTLVSGSASPGLLVNGTNVIAVEIHQERGSSSDLSFDFELVGVFNNVLPTVFLTGPTNGAVFTAPTTIPLAAQALDTDGAVAKVEFFVDGAPLGEDTTVPFALGWSNVAFGGDFTLTAVATDNAGGQTMSPPVAITILGNRLPTVAITSPANGAALVVPATIAITAQAADSDGSVTNVAFLANGVVLGNDTASPFGFNWPDATPGTYVLTALASDELGLSVTSAPVTVTLVNTPPPQDLILWNSVWRYLDNGSDQGTAWRGVTFADNGWAFGPAELGYGDGDEATTVSYGGNSNNKYPTTYFRQSFLVTDPTIYLSLFVDLLFDDGGVVYLNGNEVFRVNMPGSVISYQTYALTGPSDNARATTNLPGTLLQSGTNVVAVEIHQDGGSSSDISFNLRLIGNTTNALPAVTLTQPSDQAVFIEPADLTLTATATDGDGTVTNVQFFQGDILLGQDPTPPFNLLWPAVMADRYSLRAVATDNFGESSTSAVVTVFVVISTAPTVESFTPPPGLVSRLTHLTVTFGEPVTGMDAADLLVNGVPATGLAQTNTAFTFTFPQPAEGRVEITWAADHGIVDRETPPKAFNPVTLGNTALFQLVDLDPPGVAFVEPAPNATLPSLTRLRVTFNEPVGGVRAQDLRLNGLPAQSVSGSLSGPYEFDVAQPAFGAVLVSWATNQAIRDLADARNPLAGASWNYTLTAAPLETGVIINELMYSPASGAAAEEFLELFNTNTVPVNLTGWEITGGVDFKFPATNIAAGGYLVVAADLPTFAARYPAVTRVVGPWTGRLSNADDTLRLRNALGDIVNEVHYADDGEWGVRVRGALTGGEHPNDRGWDWFTEADGGGKSLELINPRLANDNGQNWTVSTPMGGTPGQVNSVTSGNIAPLIYDVAHSPLIPSSTDPVTITARVVDESPAGPATVTLNYRNASTAYQSGSAPAMTVVAMSDDGQSNDGAPNDGLFGAVLAPLAPGTIIEFNVSAADAQANTRTWPAPPQSIPTGGTTWLRTANALFQVDEEHYTGGMPMIRLIMTQSELSHFNNTSRNRDDQMNATLIISDGVDLRVRHNISVRYRGQGTRGRNPANYRINLPSDRRYNGLDAFNLNGQFIHAQLAGNTLTLKAGVPSSAARVVQVRVNGVNYVPTGTPNKGTSAGGGFGAYVMLEPQNGDWAVRHFPDDNNGNFYRCIPPAGGWGARLDWRGTDPSQYYGSYSKTSNQGENDWTDMVNLCRALSSGLPDDQFVQQVRNNLNVEEWMRYIAVGALLVYSENGLLTGVGDDYSMYRGANDPRFNLVMHDCDTVMGEGDGDYNSWGTNVTIWVVADRSGGNLPWANRFLRHNELAPIYFQQLLDLSQTTFSAAQLNPLLDQLLGGWVPAGIINDMKTYTAHRITRVLAQIPPRTYTVNVGLGQNGGYYYTTSAAIGLNGTGDPLLTRTVRVNGLAANWTAYTGGWNAQNVALRPGLNRLLIQWFGENAVELRRQMLEVWYDDASVANLPATIGSDLTLTAAGGPYQAANNVTVQNGATLTLEPGTTLYFNAGVGLTVANGGRLLAEGTEMAVIRFSAVPGGANWDGLTVNGGPGSPETRLAYAHFSGNGDTAIHATDGTLFLDHLTFGNTAEQYLSLDRSSFVVQYCDFPTATAGFELVHGSGGIKAGGQGLFLGNFFGRARGYNDTIDFTGGNRPGPILQLIDNVFTGSDDDILDLDSTDAWIERNIFLHVHRSGSPDSASAISGGADNADTSQITVIGNLFYNLDQVACAKQGNFYTLINNTMVHQTITGSEDPAGGIIIMADAGTAEGVGMYLEGNIIYDAENLVRNRTASIVTFTNNVIHRLTGAPWTGPGGNNVNVDPLFRHVPTMAETTNFNSWAEAQVLWDWFSLQTGSPAVGAGPNGRDLGGVIPLGVSLSGEPLSPTPRDHATLYVGVNRTGNGIPLTSAGFPDGSGFTHYRWRLNGGAWSEETPAANPIALTGLSNGLYTVEAIGLRDAGLYQNDAIYGSHAVVTKSRTWFVNTAASGLGINEILARNDRAVRIDNRYPDLVELYNSGSVAVDLMGLSLTDERDNPRKFTFPPGSVIAAGQHLVLYADNDNTPPGLHLGFALNQNGDDLYLFSGQGHLLDSVSFGLQVADLSIGRLPDGTWGLTQPTLGLPNVAVPLGEPDRLLINEWLAAGISPTTEDFIELYNPGPRPVALSGLFLTDTPESRQNLHAIAPLSYIASAGYTLFLADGSPGAGADHVNFRLAAEQGMLGLLASDRRIIDLVVYGPQTNNVAMGRSPNGSTNVTFVATATPGSPNPQPPGAIGLHLVINEVLAKNVGVSLENIFGTGLANPTPEYIELYNPTPNTLDLEEMSLTDDAALPRKYILPGITLPSQARLLLMADGDAPASASNTGFGIKANGDTIYLYDKAGNGGSLLDSISYGVQARDLSIGRFPVGSSNWVLTLATPGVANVQVSSLGNPMQLRLNEWMADPRPGDDDWIEIYNPGVQPVALSGLYLTDDLASPTKFQIAPLSFIGTEFYGFERFIADNNVTAGPDHLNFRLSGSGEALGLYLNATTPIDIIPNFGQQIEGVSQGRLPDGATNFLRFAATASPGDANYLSLTNVVISEVLTHSDHPALEDAIELRNTATQPVDVSGWYLSDQERDLKKYRIPAGTIIPVNGFAVLYEYQFNDPIAGASERFALDSAKGDQVHLSAALADGTLTGYRTAVSFDAAARDVSFGRYTNSVGALQFVALSRRTFGMDNPEFVSEFRTGTGLPNALPVVGPIVINEIMYHPPDLDGVDNVRDEFIELYNFTSTNVPLYDPQYPTNTWRLRDAIRLDFPPSVEIPAGEYLIAVSFNPVTDTNSLAAFRARYSMPANVPLVGPYEGKLDNGGESVELQRPDPPEPPGDPDAGYVPYVLVEQVNYSDSAPWDPLADGAGASLHRLDPAEFGNDPGNWFAASPTPGPQGLLDSDADGMPDDWELAYGLDPHFNDALLDADGDGLRNLDEYRAGTLPNDPADRLAVDLNYAAPVRLTFNAVADRAYVVEYSETLAPGDWSLLASVPAQGATRVEVVTDPTPTSARFYRVRLVLTP